MQSKSGCIATYAVDVLGSHSGQEILFLEQAGGSENSDASHAAGDVKKVINEAINGLRQKLRNFRNCPTDIVHKIKTFAIQIIDDRMTLLAVNLIGPKLYGVVELKSCLIPLSWEDRDLFVSIFDMMFCLMELLTAQRSLPAKIRSAQLEFAESTTNSQFLCSDWL